MKEQNTYTMDFLDTSSDNVTEDQVLDYLAGIIADIYLAQETKKNEKDTLE